MQKDQISPGNLNKMRMIILPDTKTLLKTIVIKIAQYWDFPGGQWLRLRTPEAGGLGSIPGQETRSHMPQLKKKKKKNSIVLM